jgi:4-amino-4-deoxy-L-arabinose transferase-like glycosyltransferase
MNRKLLWILLLALLIRLFTFCGYQGTPDEMINVDIIRQIIHGTWPTYDDDQHIVEMIMPVRIGFVGVSAALVKLFGFSDFSVAIYPLCASLLTVLVVYFLGRRWVGEAAGLWAALLFAVFPLDIIFATKLYSESVLTFYFALSVLLFFIAEREGSGRRSALAGFFAGLVIGFAYLHKETAGFFCVLFALIGSVNMIRERKILWRYVFLLLGFAVVFGFEMGFQAWLHHDPLYRYHVLLRQGANQKMILGLRGELDRSLPGALKRLFWTFPLSSLVSFRLGAFYWFIFPSFLYCLVRRPKALWPPLLWFGFLVPFTVLNVYFGGLPYIARQSIVFTVPGLILLAAVLAESREWAWLRTAGTRKASLVLLAVLVVASSAAVLSLGAFQKPILQALARLYMAKAVMPMETQAVEWILRLFLKYILAGGLVLALFFAILTGRAWRLERQGQGDWPGRLLAPLVAGFLAVSSVALAYSENKGFPYSERDAFQALEKLPPKTIYADWYTKQILDFHFGMPEKERVVEFSQAPLGEIHNAYLVYNAFRKNLAAHLGDIASEMVAFPQFDRYVYAYDQVDAARCDSWKQAANVNNGLILIYEVP